VTAGRVLAGTSGFSYPDWAPRFYPAGTRAADMLSVYASRLPAVELNATFRRRPTVSAIRGWVGRTPPGFRFAVKAQRGSAVRALMGSPRESVSWLTEPLGEFGDRLGAVLFRVPGEIRRDGPWVGADVAQADARLAALLAAWPRSIPLVVELQDPSWHVDETFAALRAANAVLCTTELPPDDEEAPGGPRRGRRRGSGKPLGDQAEAGPPTIRRTGPFLYLRLRLHDYDDAALAAWAARIEPFVSTGDDAYVFFRHDAVGRASELALDFLGRFEAPASG
jgi:uncharacterized protein YecE (DUF72 family)